jgi:hypothetical protein
MEGHKFWRGKARRRKEGPKRPGCRAGTSSVRRFRSRKCPSNCRKEDVTFSH